MLQGLAKTAFWNIYQCSPWQKEKRFSSEWPLLDIFLLQQRITYLDYILTQRLLEQYPQSAQETAFFICHLILAAREGHLCIRIEGNSLTPSVKQLWRSENGNTFSFDETNIIEQLIIQGSHSIPDTLITELVENSFDSSFFTPLCRHEYCFYLQRHWIFETLFLKHFKHHSSSLPKILLAETAIRQSVQDLFQAGKILIEQAQAIENACLHPLSIITGGPGTGKTYTAGQLILLFWKSLSKEQRQNCHIVLAAPTGKAVANLQKSLASVSNELEDCQLVSKTLHSLLGIKGPTSFKESSTRLLADLVIIDECSMIDVQLMALLFQSITPDTRVVLLGDRHQLPSVEAGSVFADLIELALHQKGLIPCTHLKKCLRSDLESIVDFAAMINRGEANQALNMLQNPVSNGIHWKSLSLDRKEAEAIFMDHIKDLFPSLVKGEVDAEKCLGLFQTIRILSPMRKGPFGVDALNALLWTHFSRQSSKEGWLAAPIMITHNDYRCNLFNGETGTLMRKLPLNSSHSEDYALFPSREGDEIRQIPIALLPKYEYAYCLSVHKSQGSEFDRIVLVMPEGSELFGREVFYTAVTRARKQIDIFATDVVITKTIIQKGSRISGISQRYV